MKRICIIGFFIILFLSIAIFSVLMDCFSFSDPLTLLQKQIIFQLRLPRLLNAFLVGACLALAGATFQGVLQNPLADPYILGVSSGASFFVVVAMSFGVFSVFGLTFFSFLGAMSSILIILLIIAKLRNSSVLYYLLIGLMINAFFSALTMLIMFLSKQQLTGMMIWLMGHIEYMNYYLIFGLFGIALICFFLLMRCRHAISLIAFNDETAQSLGVNISRQRIYSFTLASILTGIAVASGGVIGFVGLVIPHLCRLFFQDNFRHILPASFFAGGAFLVIVDFLSRFIFQGVVLPIGILTAFIGAPFFMVLFIRSKKHG